ncbi:MAG: transketolase C-terminal domain-containing protein [Candidatus Colwellbacteria bacterium]|nr:transketolase C-terminal domain-containing protein [Candidatus Colwellbacteria bacterium]
MINTDNNLDPDILGKSPKMAAVRSGYGEGVVAAGEADKNVVVLTADLAESTRVDEFGRRFPERFFDVGVAEQNMATVAAGLGISGKIPFISSYAVFSPGRNWEQIRTTIAYNDSNVKIAGHHAGISTGPDGATHQAIEDIATMRVMPNMKVIVPCDAIEAKKATMAIAKIWGPAYLRLSREKTVVMTTDKTPFTPGRAEIFWDTSFGTKRGKKPQVVIFSCGPIIYEALKAAKSLEKEGIGSMVINCHTIKPLDRKTVVAAAKRCGAVITVEEHNILGGLGGAIAEVLSAEYPTPMSFVGMKDEFGESGKPADLIEKYNLGEKAIISAAHSVLKGR